jgi:3-hydroxyisobutyrate dehydrogenase
MIAMKIAFLGLGRMGRELAVHLLNDGHEVTVWNRTGSAVGNFTEQGAKGVTTAVEAVDGAEVVITVLFGPDAVREVVLDGRLPIAQGALWIDITSVSPADAETFNSWATDAGIRYVHSPVVGSLAPARARALGVLLGGSPDAIAAARPIVSLWAGKDRLHEYESPAKAATAKLVANLTLAVSMQGFVEALRLGRSGGLTTDEVIQALDKTPLSAVKDLKGENVRTGSHDDTQFSTNLLAKDARLMVHTSDLPLPALTAGFQSLTDAIRAGRGEADFSVIAAGD